SLILIAIAGGAWALIYKGVVTDTENQYISIVQSRLSAFESRINDIDKRLNNIADKAHDSVETIKLHEGTDATYIKEIEEILKESRAQSVQIRAELDKNRDSLKSFKFEEFASSLISNDAFAQIVSDKASVMVTKTMDAKIDDLKSKLNQQFGILSTQ